MAKHPGTAKHPGSKTKPIKKDDSMNGAMKFFLVGCVAELYLLIVRRFYVTGNIDQVVAWDSYLHYILYLGAAVLAVGAVLSAVWAKAPKKRRIGAACLLGVGVFLTITSWLISRYVASAVNFLCVLVPVVMLLGILWSLYDRECAWSLTILGLALVVLWACRRGIGNIYWRNTVKVGAGLFLLALAIVALVIRRAGQNDGLLGKHRLFPAGTDCTPIYSACGLSAVGVILAMFSATIAFYAIWVLGVVIFGLAVYYTVKQL